MIISVSEILCVSGDFNGHIGKNPDGYEGIHGSRRFRRCNLEGEKIPEFIVADNLVILNSLLKKRESHLVTYQSSKNQSQIDYILVKWQNIKLMRDVKVIPNERCITQQRNLYQKGVYGSSNKLIFEMSFVNLLQMK